MSATAAPPAAPTPPAPAPPKPAAPAAPAPPPPPPTRTGRVRDHGVVQRKGLRAAQWYATGTARIVGDLDVGWGLARGSVSVSGKIVADQLEIQGPLDVLQTIDVRDRLTVTGTLRFGTGLSTGALSAHGVVRGEGSLTSRGLVELLGPLELTAGGLSAGHVALHGEFAVPAGIKSRSLVAHLVGKSSTPWIEAETVVIDRPFGLPRLLERFGLLEALPALRVERIEARDVYLEGVDVEYLRVKRAILGPGTHVTRIDGTIAKQDRHASVGPRSKTPPPHGISR
jgi:hypothetical protein